MNENTRYNQVNVQIPLSLATLMKFVLEQLLLPLHLVHQQLPPLVVLERQPQQKLRSPLHQQMLHRKRQFSQMSLLHRQLSLLLLQRRKHHRKTMSRPTISREDVSSNSKPDRSRKDQESFRPSSRRRSKWSQSRCVQLVVTRTAALGLGSIPCGALAVFRTMRSTFVPEATSSFSTWQRKSLGFIVSIAVSFEKGSRI